MRRRSLLLRMLPPLLALGLLPWAAAGQRMMPGRWGVALHAGAPLGWRAGQARPLDWMAGVGVARYLQGYHQLQAEALYSRALYHAGALRAPVEDWVLQLGYSRMLWARWDRALLWHAAAHASLGYEEVNRGAYRVPGVGTIRNESTWVVGAQLATSLEAPLADRLVLLVYLRAGLIFRSRLFWLRPAATLGLRWDL